MSGSTKFFSDKIYFKENRSGGEGTQISENS